MRLLKLLCRERTLSSSLRRIRISVTATICLSLIVLLLQVFTITSDNHNTINIANNFIHTNIHKNTLPLELPPAGVIKSERTDHPIHKDTHSHSHPPLGDTKLNDQYVHKSFGNSEKAVPLAKQHQESIRSLNKDVNKLRQFWQQKDRYKSSESITTVELHDSISNNLEHPRAKVNSNVENLDSEHNDFDRNSDSVDALSNDEVAEIDQNVSGINVKKDIDHKSETDSDIDHDTAHKLIIDSDNLHKHNSTIDQIDSKSIKNVNQNHKSIRHLTPSDSIDTTPAPTVHRNHLSINNTASLEKTKQVSEQVEQVSTAKDSKEAKKKKKPSKTDPFKLPDDYPYFDTPYPPARVGNYLCRDSLCSEFLSTRDVLFFKYGVSHMRMSNKLEWRTAQPGKCHFMDGRHRAPVALASFPGSGNTWIRGLLEQATGICTGSVYFDVTIRGNGMNGEGLRSGSVIVTKIHKGGKSKDTIYWTDVNTPSSTSDIKVPVFGAAILVVRNPFRAFIAEWTRLQSVKYGISGGTHNGHVNQVQGPERFLTNHDWNIFVKTKLPVWRGHFATWLVNGTKNGHPVMVVRYEDVKANSFHEVKRMLNFLNISYNKNELREKMAEDFGTFHRKHSGEEFDHFTPQQSSLVRDTITKTIDYLKQHNHGDTLKLEEYLQ